MKHLARIQAEFLKLASPESDAEDNYQEFIDSQEGEEAYDEAHYLYPKSNSDSKQTDQATDHIMAAVSQWIDDTDLLPLIEKKVEAGLT